MDQDNDTFKGATRELTLGRVAHVLKLGRHSLLSTKRLTTAFDAPMRVYPAAATIRPRFGRNTLVFRSIRPDNGLLENRARSRADMKELQTPLPAARSTVTAKATKTRAQVGATRGQVPRARHRHSLPATNLPRPPPYHRPSHHASGCHIAPHSRLGEAVSSDTATRGGGARHGHFSPRPEKTSYYTSSLESREAVSKESESEQYEPEGVGGSEGVFQLERVEHETGEVFGPEGAT